MVYEVIGGKLTHNTTYLEIIDDAKESSFLLPEDVVPYFGPSSFSILREAFVETFPKKDLEVTVDIEEERDTTYFLSIESEGPTNIDLNFSKELSRAELLKVLEILT